VTALCDLGIRDVDVEPRSRPFRDANVGVALGATVGSSLFVTEDATESARDVRSAVETLVLRGSEGERCHADTPVSANLIAGRR
jgi:hypothetical protein